MTDIPSPITRRSFLAGGVLVGGACALSSSALTASSSDAKDSFGTEGLPTLLELGTSQMTRIGRSVWVAQIAKGVWLHTTTDLIPGGYWFPANGLILERPAGSLLLDTGYTPEQAELLWQWANQNLSGPIVTVIPTDFHRDRLGGIDALKKHGVQAQAHPQICRLASENHLPVPDPINEFVDKPYRLASDCELFFPGAGHTRVNIVAWLPQHQLLMGGCFLKSVTSANLGNLADAVVSEWSGSIERLRAHYPAPKITVPGHGTISGDSITHTLKLLSAQATTQPS
jgi:Zn-dependent hydrolases, including glyoxylases